MTVTKNRVIETVVGFDAAMKCLAGLAKSWNDCNGADRMQAVCRLSFHDTEGSGEFFEAVCLNINSASCAAEEIYEIQTCW